MVEVRPGSRVQHVLHGRGSVMEIVFGGRARVRFDAAPLLPRTLPRGDLRPEEAEASPAAARSLLQVEPVQAGIENRAAADLRQTIEALRMGVVPARNVREYTVAREEALASIDRLLTQGTGLRVLWGDYGAGKSHMLDLVETVARESGFVTARIALDPHEVPPAHPQRLYRAIVTRLRLPGDAGNGLDGLLARLVDSTAHREADGAEASRFFSPMLAAIASGDDEAVGWVRDYALGSRIDSMDLDRVLRGIGWRGVRPLALSDFRTYGRVYMHMIGTLASWARDAGLRGLLLLLDEVEFVDSLPKEELHFAGEVLAHFAAATLPPESLRFDPEALYKGGHEVHRRIPLRFREDQPLAVLFAATPLDEIRSGVGGLYGDPEVDVNLAALGPEHGPELVRRIYRLYLGAYPDFRPADEALAGLATTIVQAIRSGALTRELVRGTTFLLDRLRLLGSID